MSQIHFVVTSHYGTLSRGRHSARKKISKSEIQWADKDARGNLVINSPGEWYLHCSDGFRREARAVLIIKEDGSYEFIGDTNRFRIVEAN